MKIFIDPGHNHSGADTGAQGNGLREQDITFYIAKELRDVLSPFAEVMLSRNDVTDNVGKTLTESINNRARMANDWQADLFISIHCNAYADSRVSGTETLIYSNKGLDIAAMINNAITADLGTANRGVKIRTDLGVLKQTNMPAVLAETAFITNLEDANKLKYRAADFAKAIARAITRYYGLGEFNMVETAQQALKVLQDKGIINTPEHWEKAVGVVKHFDVLLIKIANALKG